jgi:hypothetical protein
VRGLDRWAASPNKAIRPATTGSAANSQIGCGVTLPCFTQSAQYTKVATKTIRDTVSPFEALKRLNLRIRKRRKK